MKTIKIDLTPKQIREGRRQNSSDSVTRYQQALAQSPPAARDTPGASYIASRMSNRSGGAFGYGSRSPPRNKYDNPLDNSRLNHKEDPTGAQTISRWK